MMQPRIILSDLRLYRQMAAWLCGFRGRDWNAAVCIYCISRVSDTSLHVLCFPPFFMDFLLTAYGACKIYQNNACLSSAVESELLYNVTNARNQCFFSIVVYSTEDISFKIPR
jgi:hypothetical protein